MAKANDEIGPYTLIKQLGKGAFGAVWLAEKRTAIVTSQVAIKIALEEEADLDTIKQEANLWAQIGGHSNVLPMIEANIYDGQVVIVSEYVSGGSLESWLKKNGGKAPSVEQAVNITLGILSGLEHLHAKKVLHRDLKPANVLLQGETPRLADFGLSRILKTTSPSTSTSGTPAYMSPEAFDGKKIIQTDLWGVGVIFYQLLTGNLPFIAEDYTGLIGAIFNKDPQPLPNPFECFQPIVNKVLEKSPNNRYQTTEEMKTELEVALVKYQQLIVSKLSDKENVTSISSHYRSPEFTVLYLLIALVIVCIVANKVYFPNDSNLVAQPSSAIEENNNKMVTEVKVNSNRKENQPLNNNEKETPLPAKNERENQSFSNNEKENQLIQEEILKQINQTTLISNNGEVIPKKLLISFMSDNDYIDYDKTTVAESIKKYCDIISLKAVNLNDDGITDFIIENGWICGSSGCELQIYLGNINGFTHVFPYVSDSGIVDEGVNASLELARVLTIKSNDCYNILVKEGSEYESILKFNGTKYFVKHNK